MSLTKQILYSLSSPFTFNPALINFNGTDQRLFSNSLPVVWGSLVNATASGSTITSPSNNPGNSSGVSVASMASGDCAVEFKSGQITGDILLGLTTHTAGSNYTSLDFCMECFNGTINIYESGILKGNFGAFLTTDVLRIESASGVIKYKKNGTVLYTSLASPVYPLYVKATFYSVGSFNSVNFMSGLVPYSTSNPNCLLTTGFYLNSLSPFVETASVSGSDAVKYTLVIGGLDYYWNGSAVVLSNGTYAQANLMTEINTNIAAFSALCTLGVLFQLRNFLHSNDGTTTPVLIEVDVVYTPFFPAGVEPNKCICYLRVKDFLGISVSSAELLVTAAAAFLHNGFLLAQYVVEAVADVNGFIEISLYETATINQPLRFQIEYTDPNDGRVKPIIFQDAIVPNAVSQDLSAILVVKP